ncbi:MAG: hypothetical protein GX084_05715 [Acholeplasmataceae bacterium]|nr:hypothetical protein [Acidaminococcaceae bacterium]NLY84094.1 hypothetical protein [Acholeplasmataceae bacterium]
MDNISVLLFWGFIMFILPRMLRRQEKKKTPPEQPREYPPQNTRPAKPGAGQKAEDFWLTWGLPEREPEEGPMLAAPTAVQAEQVKSRVSLKNKAKPQIVSEKKRAETALSRAELRRGILLAEILGKPRALKPYDGSL